MWCGVRMTDDLVQDLRRIVETERARFEVPGCAVLVVADGRIVLSEGFGYRDVDRELPVTSRTLFPIGSSTKTFTAALCAALVEKGELAWDRPAREYLPGFRMRDPVTTDQLTVFDMLCHRSGLPRHDLMWYAARDEMTRAELVAALRHLEPNRGFRQTWQYNNLLYTVVGELAGRVVGTSYEFAVREYLLDPLRMARTNFSVDETQADDDAATPYVARGPREAVKEVPFARLDLVSPAGAINSCVEELGRWLLTLLGLGVDGRPPLLSESVMSLVRTPAMPLPDASLLAVGRPVGYGLGLLIEDYRGYRLVHHGGNIDGFSSQVSSIPEARCGVVVLCNRDGTTLRDALPCLIYDRLLGLEPRPHGEALLAKEAALWQGRAQSRKRTLSARNGLPPVRPLRDYVGRYRNQAYGELAVAEGGEGLNGRYRSLSGRLEHRHLEVFNFVVDLGGIETPLPVQFHHNFDGDVSAASAQVEPTVAAIRFERVPDTAHLTDAVLDRLAGSYRLGPLTASVARRGERGLVAMIAEGGFKELKPVRGLVFTMDGARLEFTDDGRLITPIGEFTRG
jgi:CubicO group peptidase (beta-lactamase class C family)